MRYVMLSDKGWEGKMVSDILTRVRHLMVDVNLHTLAGYPEEYGMDHLGYATTLDHNSSLVSCDQCSHHKPAGATHLFRADILPFRQCCHLCGKVMERGIVQHDKWDNPLPEEDRDTLTYISVPITYVP
jgi:hypothetical protein